VAVVASVVDEYTSLWNFVLNSGLRKFRHCTSIVATCCQLSSIKVGERKLDRRCESQLLTIPASLSTASLSS